MLRLNLRFKRPEVLPGGAGIFSGIQGSNYQFRQLHDQFSRLTIDNLQLRQNLQQKNKLIQQLKNILSRFENFFTEEIVQNQLQQSKLALVDETIFQVENFAKDVDNLLNIFMQSSKDQQNSSSMSALKRILLRFLHQRDFYHQQVEKEFKKLDELIAQKQQFLDDMRRQISAALEQEK